VSALTRATLVALLALAAASAPAADSTVVRAVPLERARLGTGWVVWESNRSGSFRIWGRSFAGEPAHRLSREERGRDHCCARISPDGERLVYLSLPGGARKYLAPSIAGDLHLVRLADGADRVLSPSAHHYGEHRAAEWWSPSELVYLDVDGTTRLLDLTRATSRTLARAQPGAPGWLVDPTGSRAAGGAYGFAERDPATGAIHPVTPYGGCQHEISADGRVGFWAAGAGGPIDWIDLATWTTHTLLRKNDPRLPADRGYLYFPMLSRDRSLLAFAASGGEHDHFKADYDVFLIELDADTLEVRGVPIRVTREPSVDRFPDVWRLAPPRGEALPVALPAPPAPPSASAPAFLWNDAADLNRRAPGAPSEILDAHGAAWTDRVGRLALAGGYFSADRESGRRISDAVRSANELTLALLVEPATLDPAAGGPILALTNSPRQRSFLLRQRGPRLELVLRTSDRGGPSGGEPVEIGRLPDAGPHHVAIRYSPGRLAVFVDGRAVVRQPFAGDFFHWRSQILLAGAEANDDARFRGALSRIGIWARELPDDEIAALAREALRPRAEEVPRSRVEARLVERSRAARLDEISPYRRALVLERWELVRPLDGPAPPRFFRVARWSLLDGEPVAAARRAAGDTATLIIEPYDRQPQLESVVLSDTLPPAPREPLFFDVDLTPP